MCTVWTAHAGLPRNSEASYGHTNMRVKAPEANESEFGRTMSVVQSGMHDGFGQLGPADSSRSNHADDDAGGMIGEHGAISHGCAGR